MSIEFETKPPTEVDINEALAGKASNQFKSARHNPCIGLFAALLLQIRGKMPPHKSRSQTDAAELDPINARSGSKLKSTLQERGLSNSWAHTIEYRCEQQCRATATAARTDAPLTEHILNFTESIELEIPKACSLNSQ